MSTDTQWSARMPEMYDHYLGPVLFSPFADQLADRVAAVNAQDVLEVAAGTGILTRALLDRLTGTARVTATDVNLAMVRYGQGQVGAACWHQADATDLPFVDHSFDVVACGFGVMFFPDKPSAYSELARVLRPDGKLMFTVWGPLAECPFPVALQNALSDLLPEGTPDFIARIPHGYARTAEIRADLAAAGLTCERLETVRVTAHAPSARTLATGFCCGTPLKPLLENRGDLTTLTDAIAEHMTTELGAGPVDEPLTAFLVTARRESSVDTRPGPPLSAGES